MKAEVVTLAARDNPHAQRWADAVRCDIDAGLVPVWIGAVIVSVFDDGTARLTFVRWVDWLAAKMQRQIEAN